MTHSLLLNRDDAWISCGRVDHDLIIGLAPHLLFAIAKAESHAERHEDLRPPRIGPIADSFKGRIAAVRPPCIILAKAMLNDATIDETVRQIVDVVGVKVQLILQAVAAHRVEITPDVFLNVCR